MTITRILYFIVSYNVHWSVIQGIQPDGYLGCFEDSYGESLPSSRYYTYYHNKGKVCKARCKDEDKRYAGTTNNRCYCGSAVVQDRKRSSTQCNAPCPGNSSESCGGYYNSIYYNRISLYDTWLCITSPCQNGATCRDIDADSYNCSCSVGWTGRVCNETVTTTTSTNIPSSSSQAIGSSTKAPQPEGNKLAVFIAVPVSIVVIIVFILIVAVLILRKKLNQKKDSKKAVYQNSTNTGHLVFTVVNNAYNDHDIIPLEIPVNVHATKDKEADPAKGESEHNYYTLEQSENGGSNNNNANQRRSSAIQNDDNDGYGHFHVRSTTLCDPTYSHTTTTHSQVTTDYTYSHMDQSVGNKNHEVMSNVDHDTYNTCNMKGGVEINDVDDTYNRLAISGKATNIDEKPTVSSLNEPDYDHTDVRNH